MRVCLVKPGVCARRTSELHVFCACVPLLCVLARVFLCVRAYACMRMLYPCVLRFLAAADFEGLSIMLQTLPHRLFARVCVPFVCVPRNRGACIPAFARSALRIVAPRTEGSTGVFGPPDLVRLSPLPNRDAGIFFQLQHLCAAFRLRSSAQPRRFRSPVAQCRF
jgi:hypothetical protein